MESKYVIIGGGMSADTAARALREVDASGKITLVSGEKHPPYNRPPLSKGLWTGTDYESIWRHTEDENITLQLETNITHLDPDAHQVTDSQGNTLTYEKLLLATGGTPRPLDGALTYRTLDDYHTLRSLYEQHDTFLIIGAGYIGTELAASLAMNGKKVTLVFRSPTIGSKKYPKGFSSFLSAYFTEQGVKLIPNANILSATPQSVTLASGETLTADAVIAGLGITPNTQLAEQANLEISDGIVVNSNLQTSHPDIYACGDVANFYNPLLDKRLRCEHEDMANTSGHCAGLNMAGQPTEFTHLPSFYSDLFELGFEAIGEISSDLDIIEDWHDLYRKGVIYYLRDGHVRGASTWGIWDQLEPIRELIASREKFTATSLLGRVTI